MIPGIETRTFTCEECGNVIENVPIVSAVECTCGKYWLPSGCELRRGKPVVPKGRKT